MKRSKPTWMMATVAAVAMLVASPRDAQAAPFLRTAPEATPVWAKLDAARGYRAGFADRGFDTSHGGPIGKDFPTLIADYQVPLPQFGGLAPQALIQDALLDFELLSFSPFLLEEATEGIRESLGELMTGQLLLGNDALERALRVRLPRVSDGSTPSLADFARAVRDFDLAIARALDNLRAAPGRLRARGAADQQFAFFVENSIPAQTPDAAPEVVESELRRLTELLQRRAVSTNELAGRTFEAGFRDPAGLASARSDASQLLKQSAQTTYLTAALLHAVQGIEDFELNNGFLLNQRYSEAERAFDNVMSGDNPFRKDSDFIPFEPPERFLQSCSGRINEAASSELAARSFTRQFDQDRTALQQALFDQRQSFGVRIEQIAGLPLGNFPDLAADDPARRLAERARLLSEAEQRARAGTTSGALAQQVGRIAQAEIARRRALEVVRQIPEKVRIEQDRANAVARVQFRTGQQVAALTFVESIARSAASAAPDEGLLDLIFSASGVAAGAAATVQLLRAVEAAEITQINSAVTVKLLLLDQLVAAIEVESAEAEIAQQNRILDDLRAQLLQAASAFAESNDNLAAAFFANPGSRILRDVSVVRAERDFDLALQECFEAAKALEYAFSEPYGNVVSSASRGLETVPGAENFPNAESVFAATSADTGLGNLREFLRALGQWDKFLRENQRRTPAMSTFVRNLSLKRDLLHIDSGDAAFDALRFSDLLRRQRVFASNPVTADLMLEVPLDITDTRLLGSEPNTKLVSIASNVLGPRSLLPVAPLNPPTIWFRQAGDAFTRGLRGSGAGEPPLLVRNLDTFGEGAFTALVQTRVEARASEFPGIDNVQLAGQSPFVSRFILQIDTSRLENEAIDFDMIDDIVITLNSRFGLPPAIQFPL